MRILKLGILLNQAPLERNPNQSIALFARLVLTMLRDKSVYTRALVTPALFSFSEILSSKAVFNQRSSKTCIIV